MNFSPKASPAQRQKAAGQLIATLNADRNPILLGPWRSEVGFECMYWLPFLQFLASKVMKFDQRAAIVTRGGLAPLYKHVAAQGFDLYALRSVTDVRRENLYDAQVKQGGKTIKQLQITDWDEAVLEDAARELKLGAVYHTIHPAWMYWALEPFWAEQAGMGYLASMTDYRLLPKPELAQAPQLPAKFVAVKCYHRPTFPYPDPVVAEWTRETVAIIAAQTPVVLLNSSADHDDHMDVPMSGPNIFTLTEGLAPEVNLLVQAAVLAKATAFVGTYGGVAQLALRMGIPSVSAWLEFGGTCYAHLSLSQWLAKVTKVPFVAGGITDYGLIKQIVSLPVKVEQVAA
jgi:hypothetical protein